MRTSKDIAELFFNNGAGMTGIATAGNSIIGSKSCTVYKKYLSAKQTKWLQQVFYAENKKFPTATDTIYGELTEGSWELKEASNGAGILTVRK